MELIFLIISFVISSLIIYTAGRFSFSREQLIETLSENKNLCYSIFAIVIFLTFAIMGALVTVNEDSWHLPYLLFK